MATNPGPPTDTTGPSASPCDPDDIALKSFFLGPQSENADWLEEVFRGVLTAYFSWRRRTFPEDGRAISDGDLETPQFRRQRREIAVEMQRLLARFESEVPKFSPRYIGHMFSETSMPAMIGHVITLLHNPNNVSGESSRVGIEVEGQAIDALAQMLGYDTANCRGHFTSGGTVANFEAMVRARQRMERFMAVGAAARDEDRASLSLFEAAHMGWSRYDELSDGGIDVEDARKQFAPTAQNPFAAAHRLHDVFEVPYRGPVVLVPGHKHYSWTKGVELMGLGAESFWSVQLDEHGQMDLDDLRAQIERARQQQRPIMMVVSVAGTTELGTFDPVGHIQDVLDEYEKRHGLHIYHHVDAAYGGFFAANVCGESPCVMGDGVCNALESIQRTNSVTLDPHKLGYVPYASGAFVCADRREYFASTIDAPYLDLDHDRDPGPQTIEGSRSAAGAVATYLTARTIGLDADGYGRILRRTIQARHELRDALGELEIPVRLAPGASNILTFCVAYEGESLSETNARTRQLYNAFSPEQDGEFFVSKTTLRHRDYAPLIEPFIDSWNGEANTDELTLIRLCIMNPFINSRETETDFPTAFARAVASRL